MHIILIPLNIKIGNVVLVFVSVFYIAGYKLGLFVEAYLLRPTRILVRVLYMIRENSVENLREFNPISSTNENSLQNVQYLH